MGRVAALEESVIRQIAAGEVVERPASVVKELLENSIDAGASRITLETEGSGRELIRISDDGCGMSPEDAELALQRHTTSKIKNIADLEALHTFGFRGEALPSIASVCKMELATREPDEDTGTVFSLDGGKLVEKKPTGRSNGTTIEIRDLFFNTPARLKFLKSESTEKSRILQTFEEVAFAHPHLFLHYKSKNIELPARSRLIDRIADIWGKNFSEETMFPVSFEHPLLKIEGWVSKPQSHQATRNYQIFYVNQRPIQSRLISHALYEAFRDCLPVGRHPSAILFLNLDPSQVDVNVHPSKREVRFRDESQIHQAVVNEIRRKRAGLSDAPKVFGSPFASSDSAPSGTPSLRFPDNPASGFPSASHLDVPLSVLPLSGSAPGSAFSPSANFNAPSGASAFRGAASGAGQTLVEAAAAPRVLAQFSALYIIAEQGENLVIVDQHAAAERVLYERFRAALTGGQEISAQPLLIPLLWNVSLSQAEILRGQLATFQKLGFAIEPFGETTFRVSEIPALVEESELRGALDATLKALEDDSDPLLTSDHKIAHMACRAAIKANDRLSNRELSDLLVQLSKCDNPHTCPHGRPITLTLSRPELDKKFGRT